MNYIDLAEAAAENGSLYAAVPFYKDGKPYGGDCPRGHNAGRPLWGMSLLKAGSMRFKWNEENPKRAAFLRSLSKRYGGKEIVPIELVHSKTVFAVKGASDTFQKQGDGIVTKNANLIPLVTAADCMPLYFYDSRTGAFGAVHSGWKGTGIAAAAIDMMKREFGSEPRDILAAIGAHIRDCCYVVGKERALRFMDEFGSGAAKRLDGDARADGGISGRQKNARGETWALSLLGANMAVLAAAGIREENVVAAKNCTACDARFGSFRRQAAFLDVPQEEKARLWTAQAAFVIMDEREKQDDGF